MDDAVFRMFQDLLEFQEETLKRLEEIEKQVTYLSRFVPEYEDCDIPLPEGVKAPSPSERDQLILDTYPYCLLKDKPNV